MNKQQSKKPTNTILFHNKKADIRILYGLIIFAVILIVLIIIAYSSFSSGEGLLDKLFSALRSFF